MTRVRSTDGTGIELYRSGASSGPLVVAIHGYPDDHTVWDGVAADLGRDFQVVTYDVRGAGASDVPAGGRAAYRIPHLIADLRAVLDEVAPTTPVHLVAHDWGSVQAWPALTDPSLAGRIAGFTSISGPSLEHASVWMRSRRTAPRDRLRQLAHSYYTLAFQLPGLPELAVRRGLIDRTLGRPASDRGHADQRNGLNLYRANMLRGLRRAEPAMVPVPVQVLAPADDPFIIPALALQAPEPFVADLRTHVVPGEHWVVSRHPDRIAARVRSFVETVDKRAP